MVPSISCKGWTLENILTLGDHVKPIQRIGVLADKNLLFNAISLAESKGEPLVIHSFHTVDTWDRKIFSPEWIIEHGEPNITARNAHTWSDVEIGTADFFSKARNASPHIIPGEKERLYAKDAQCPYEWIDFLCAGNCPPQLLPYGQNDYLIPGKITTLMCYFGIGDTATPAHKDLCASSGHNLMVYTEKGGSAFWFMSKSSDARQASEFFQQLGHELDHENLYLTLDLISQAPFDIFVTEQKMGDFIMVPPRSCHQVVNNGGLTMKISWSRMTLAGLPAAFYHELPMYQRVCRPEVYRIKETVYYSLETIMDVLNRLSLGNMPAYRFGIETDTGAAPSTFVADYFRVLQTLLALFDDILIEEHPPSDMTVEMTSTGDHLTCDFCGADIFHSFFECRTCAASSTDSSYSLCARCFVDGRGCSCRAMTPQQCRPFQLLLDRRAQTLHCLQKMNELFHLQETARLESQFAPSQQLESSDFGIFRAACLMWKQRQAPPQQLRACSATTPSHRVPNPDALLCRVCHNSRCYEHILHKYNVHSSIAIFIHTRSQTHKPWHIFHQESRKSRFADGDRLEVAQRQGVKPEAHANRSWIVTTFRISQPQSTKSTLGWYDEDIDGFRSYTSGFLDEDSLGELTDLTSESAPTPTPSLEKDMKAKRKRKSDSALAIPQKKQRSSRDVRKLTNDEELSDSVVEVLPKTVAPVKKRTKGRKKPIPAPSTSSQRESVVEAETVSAPARIHRKKASPFRTEGSMSDAPDIEPAAKIARPKKTVAPVPTAKVEEDESLPDRPTLKHDKLPTQPPTQPLDPPFTQPPMHTSIRPPTRPFVPHTRPVFTPTRPFIQTIQPFIPPTQPSIQTPIQSSILPPTQPTTPFVLSIETLGEFRELSSNMAVLREEMSKMHEALDKQRSNNFIAAPPMIATSAQDVADLAHRTLDAEGIVTLVNLLQPSAQVSDAQIIIHPKSPESIPGVVASTSYSPDRCRSPLFTSDDDNRRKSESRSPGKHRISDSASVRMSRSGPQHGHDNDSRPSQPSQTSNQQPLAPFLQHRGRGRGSSPNRGRVLWPKKHYRGRGRGGRFGAGGSTLGSSNKWGQGRVGADNAQPWHNDNRQEGTSSNGSYLENRGEQQSGWGGTTPTWNPPTGVAFRGKGSPHWGSAGIGWN